MTKLEYSKIYKDFDSAITVFGWSVVKKIEQNAGEWDCDFKEIFVRNSNDVRLFYLHDLSLPLAKELIRIAGERNGVSS